MEKPLVSVLIPAYNAADFLPSCLESIIKQTYHNLEIIVCNDASTDETLKVLERYAKIDGRIKVYTNEENLYIAANRNRLLTYAKGRYIAWMDADDISRADRIEKQVNLMESDPGVGICGSWLSVFSTDASLPSYIRKYPTSDDKLRRMIFRFTPVAQPSALIRKTVLDKVGDYDLATPPAEDLDMLFRIGIHYKFANIGEALIDYRDHQNSATYKKLKKIELTTTRLRSKYMKSQSYNARIGDRIYNFVHWLSIWIVPAKIKVGLFQFVRERFGA